MYSKFLAVLALLAFVPVHSIHAFSQSDFHNLDTNRLQDDFVKQNQVLKGNWRGSRFWEGIFCEGNYTYTINAQGAVKTVNFNLTSEETLDVSATVVNGYGRVDGTYLSDYTACYTTSAWLGMGVDRIDVKSQVIFSEDSTKLKVKVKSLRVSGLHIGKYVPQWFADILGDAMNRALAYVWKSQLGDWLNAKISDYLNSKLPDSIN